ncbi:MAG TPA: hypothetical protein PKW35_25755 [Nannocystaceae bacterium]|nr:hypothetical protein [Nannocystaceae bacterium]
MTLINGARWIDLAAFVGMGIVWLIIGAVILAIALILRSRSRSASEWGSTPGL